MTALRSLLFVLWLVATVIPWALAMLVLSIFQRGAPLYWGCVGWLRVAMWGMRVICGVQWRVSGMEHVHAAHGEGRPLLLAPKHQSALETLLLPTLMPRPLAYVFKRELLWVPFFGWALGRLDMVHIDRSQRSAAWAKVAEQGRRLAAQDVWVIMFPEGTRIPRGRAGQYKTGASRLALAVGIPVLPLAINSAKCWPPRSFFLRPGVVDVSIGAPIAPEGHNADSLMAEVERWVEAEMRRIDPEAYSSAER
jgi:1-acyl-sn-glycerol-3-phosphate acyltransferase